LSRTAVSFFATVLHYTTLINGCAARNCSAGSAFTHVMACTLAKSPSDSLHQRLQQFRCLHYCSDCYRVERTSSRAGLTPAVDHCLCTAHPVIRLHVQVEFVGKNDFGLVLRLTHLRPPDLQPGCHLSIWMPSRLGRGGEVFSICTRLRGERCRLREYARKGFSGRSR
jgi:hypothetical protein